jgi:hypothetical protein
MRSTVESELPTDGLTLEHAEELIGAIRADRDGR